MKAVIQTKYGAPSVLKVETVSKPTPKPNEVLVKVHAASVTAADTMMRPGTPYFGRLFLGLTKPKYPITGTGFAGVIEAIGNEVTQFGVNDSVFGESLFGSGTHAEFVCVPEDKLIVKKPSNISFQEAAPICDGALTSLNFLTLIAKVKSGQSILINGASGSLGTAAIQIAKILDVSVTAVCSDANLELVRSLGADEVIDYNKLDFTQQKQKYDVVFDTIGGRSFSQCKKILKKNGHYISPVLSLGLLMQMIKTSMIGNKKAKFSATGMLPVPKLRLLMGELLEYIEQGVLKTIIERHYPLEKIVEAHRHIELGHKKGNIVITTKILRTSIRA